MTTTTNITTIARTDEPIDAFIAGYIDCALWLDCVDTSDGTDDTSFEQAGYTADNLAPEAVTAIRVACADFMDANRDDLEEYCFRRDCSMEYAGHDFWLTRNAHGAGFWDRDIGELLGERLTEACKSWGEVSLYLGDDGLIYCC